MIPRTRTQPVCPPTLRRGVLGFGFAAVVALLLAPTGAPAKGAKAGAPIAREQQVVTLLGVKDVSARPVFGSRTLVSVADQRPITLTSTTLPVLAQTTDADGRSWLQVRLPGRVFHRKVPPPTGWITAEYTRLSTTPWHLVVDLRSRRVLAYRDGRRVRSFSAIVGAPSTPTPRGEYFIEETMRLPAKFPGAPFALAASARSKVLTEFAGGPGQIALHGVNNVGGQLGTAVSHGCVRLATVAVSWLRRHIKAGVPLTIR